MTRDEAMLLSPYPPTSTEALLWVLDTLEEVELGVPGDRVVEVELRESLVLILAGGAAVAGAVALVRRRRPY